MDCCLNEDIHAHQRTPYADEPCETYEEAKEICDMLCSTEPDPRIEQDRRGSNDTGKT